MLKSEFDPRHYQTFTTSTGLRVLLVEDKNCRRNAAAMTIGAGHFQDPQDCMGLAHLLEHLLFLGSKHYPNANEINDYLSNNGGQINAWTATENSSFHFEVATPHLTSCLQRFADMLANPLFDLDLIDKEIQAIDAEFKLKQKDDLRRLYQVHKETCNPQHPFSKFSVGNETTLRSCSVEALRERLQGFHSQYYQSGNMRFCLVSDLPLSEQKALIEDVFCGLAPASEVKAQDLPPLYLDEHLGVLISIKPIKSARRLIITFALPDTSRHYRSKPLSVISHVLGDEGPGSLLEFLKQQNWATSLSAGGGIQGSNFKDFNLNLQLTPTGLQQMDEVLNAVFYYIELMHQKLSQPWRLEEKIQLNQLAYNFSDAAKPLDDAIHYSSQMFHCQDEHLIAADYLLDKPDPGLLKDILSYLNPKNMRLKMIFPEADTDQTARWYDTPYRIEKIPDAFLAQLSEPEEVPQLTLPEPNPYLVDDVALQPHDERFAYPVRILETPGYHAWFGQDQVFCQPKGDCFVSFDCPVVEQGVEMAAHKRLLVAAWMESFNRQYYPAGVAGLNYHLYAHQAGFSLHTNGFSQKQLHLCQQILEQLHAPFAAHEVFEQVRSRQLQGLQNSLLNKPINRLFTRLSVILQRYTYAPTDLMPVVQAASIGDIERAQQQLTGDYFMESFLHGDWQIEQADALARHCSQLQGGRHTQHRLSRDVADLRNSERFLHQVESPHDDAAAVVYFQSPGADLRDVALTILTEQLVAAPFFNRIRTEKQLGYLVGTGYMPYNQHPSIAFYIQSPTVPAATLISEIHQFLEQFVAQLDQFESLWPRVKSSVIKQLDEKDTNLTMKSQRYWMAIGNDDLEFSRHNKLANTIGQLEFADVKGYLISLLQRQNFGEVILYCASKGENLDHLDGSRIDNLHNFKSSISYTI